MAIDLNVDLDEVARREGGKGLRKLLEEALKETGQLRGVAATAEAQRVIGEKGYSLISAEDLSGVALGDIEAKAAELQEQRHSERVSVVKGVLASKGLEGEELDQAVEDFLGSAPAAQEESPWGSVHEASAGDGKPAPAVDPGKLHGTAAIEYALEQAERKRK